MATKKKLLEAAAGSAGGAGANVEDFFSTQVYYGNGSAYTVYPQAIYNGIALGAQYDGGSAKFTDPDEGYPIQLDGTISLTGDFTVEAFVNIKNRATNNVMLGSDYAGAGTNHQLGIINNTGRLFVYSEPDSSVRESSSGIGVGTWYHVAFSRSGSTIYFWIDGVAAGTATNSDTFSLTCIGALEGYTGTGASFEGYMSNLRVSNNARYTSAFTAPTSDLADDANTLMLALQSTDPFTDQSGTYTLTVDGSVSADTFGPFATGESGAGGLVWTKRRVDTTIGNTYHNWQDTERGAGKSIYSNNYNAESTVANSITSFNSNGYSISTDANFNYDTQGYVSYTFKKQEKFFDIQTYTGNQTVRTISHDLGSVPGCIIIKNLDQTDANATWQVYHRSLSNNASRFLRLNSADADFGVSSWMNDTAPTSTEFTLGTGLGMNWSSQRFVAYLFAHNDGDGEFGPDGDGDAIKCGSYTGNGSSTGPEIDLGFEPQWVLIKCSSQGGSSPAYEWYVFDSMRGMTGANDTFITVNDSVAESAATYTYVKPEPAGFKIQSGQSRVNASGEDYIYIAIRRGPMATPTDAKDVFAMDKGFNASDDDVVFYSGFPIDLVIRTDPSTTYNNLTYSRLTGSNQYLRTNAGNGLTSGSYAGSLDSQEGLITDNAFNFSDHYAWMWRRAPGYLDTVTYAGNSTAGHTLDHNLGVVPEMMWVKETSGNGSWVVYHSGMDATAPEDYKMNLDTTAAKTDTIGAWNDTAPTATQFTLGTLGDVNDSGSNYIAFLFASVDGVSKVGSYTGTNATLNIDCGFSAGARLILIKRTDSTSPWWLWDTERGITTGNVPMLDLNSDAAQTTSYDWMDPYSSGFSIPAGGNNNVSAATYIFYAIA